MSSEPHKRAKIIGGPGSGKTDYLLTLIQKAAQKYEPDKIGAVSLTNAAIEEMRDRVRKETGLSKESAKNIRTIHSLLFRLLELKKEQIADKKIKEFNEAYPQWTMEINTETEEDKEFEKESEKGFSPKENQKRLSKIQILRHQMIPESKWEISLQNMYHDWKMWMFENNLIDFTGILETALERELCPEIDVLMVDEAQDISRLSMNILELWSKNVVSTVYVGDSDQAILRFAGAVPEVFINLNHTWLHVLEKTHRVPRKVYEYAMEIIEQAKNRENVEYKPTEVEGKVIRCNEPDLSLPGTHMILGRCGFHLKRWMDYLIEKSFTWHNPYRPKDKNWNPLETKLWGAVRAYIRLKNGEVVNHSSLKNMIKKLIADKNLIRGVKSKASEIIGEDNLDLFGAIGLGIFSDEFLSFKKPLEELFKLKGQSGNVMKKLSEDEIMAKPRVVVGSIHSIKGGESDHVWIDTGTSMASLEACASDERILWDECRVAYVGITRAKQTCGLLANRGSPKGRVWK